MAAFLAPSPLIGSGSPPGRADRSGPPQSCWAAAGACEIDCEDEEEESRPGPGSGSRRKGGGGGVRSRRHVTWETRLARDDDEALRYVMQGAMATGRPLRPSPASETRRGGSQARPGAGEGVPAFAACLRPAGQQPTLGICSRLHCRCRCRRGRCALAARRSGKQQQQQRSSTPHRLQHQLQHQPRAMARRADRHHPASHSPHARTRGSGVRP